MMVCLVENSLDLVLIFGVTIDHSCQLENKILGVFGLVEFVLGCFFPSPRRLDGDCISFGRANSTCFPTNEGHSKTKNRVKLN